MLYITLKDFLPLVITIKESGIHSMTIVHINWFGAYRFDHHFNEREISLQKGIYAIYRVFGGKETLLYIGLTTRSFQKRLNEHDKDWLSNVRGELKIRLGVLEFPNGGRYSEQKLKDVESLLIVWHKPSMNTSSTVYYRRRFNLVIINNGRRGLIEKRVAAEHLDWA